MGYTAQRDAIVAHAVTAAAAVSSEWTDVTTGAPFPRGNRCVRVFWTGEGEPRRMGGNNRTLAGLMVAPTCALVAFWAMPSLDESAMKVLDDEMATFVHNLRTAILADSTLGGASTDLDMGSAEPDFITIGGARWATVEVPFTLDFLEYPLGA
jgi:hypothetical protein